MTDNKPLNIKIKTRLLDDTSSDENTKLNECARLLVSKLQHPLAAQCLYDTARKFRVPLWVYLVGLLQRMYSNGEYTSPSLDIIWTMRALPLDEFATSKCETCEREFRVRWPNQRFCSPRCSPPAPAGTHHTVGLKHERNDKSVYTSRIKTGGDETGMVVEGTTETT